MSNRRNLGTGPGKTVEPTMFSRAIFATDLSDASDQIAAGLGGLLPLGTKEIVLAYCAETPSSTFEGAGYNLREAVRADLKNRTESRLESLRARVELLGFRASSRVLYGAPGPTLAAFSRESGAELIVVGSRGASLAKNIVLGSSAMDILRASPIPVFLKRLEVKGLNEQRHYRLVCRDFATHILYATDFSATAEMAFHYLEQILKATHGTVTLLHVCKSDDPQSAKEPLERLGEMRARLNATAEPHRIEISVLLGQSAADGIAKTAMNREISLLIMGTRGKGFVEELLLGSESQAVVRRVDLPILMIPPLAAVTRDRVSPAG